tara:strand:+ start:319 stop:828 length:510 start_codon:yes stop_codon:yes gene_type:complete
MKYDAEIAYLKKYNSSFRRYSDIYLEELVDLYYRYENFQNLLSERSKANTNRVLMQKPGKQTDPLTTTGIRNLQILFEVLDTFKGDVQSITSQQTSSNFNIVGKFKLLDEDGNEIIYNKGDVVYYDGKSYLASNSVSGCVPSNYLHEDCSAWGPIDLPENTIGYTESGF